jgi:transcriptional regulator with XRE-family HTH domain
MQRVMNVEPQTPAPSTEHSSFRQLLQEELLKRCRKRPGYSLRAFARYLSISPSTLSRLLRGQRPLSERAKLRLGKRLGYAPAQVLALGNDQDAALRDYRKISQDAFAVIADWHHYGILNLLHLRGFKPDPLWIGRALGITATEARAASERLIGLGLISVQPDGRWVATAEGFTNVGDDLHAPALRNLQRQVLEMALAALEEIPVEARDQSSIAMPANRKRLPEAIEKITRFRRELCAFMEQDADRDEVYQLSISLYPLTRLQKEN